MNFYKQLIFFKKLILRTPLLKTFSASFSVSCLLEFPPVIGSNWNSDPSVQAVQQFGPCTMFRNKKKALFFSQMDGQMKHNEISI